METTFSLRLTGLVIKQITKSKNAEARVVVRAGRYDHVTPIFETLRWLHVRYRIQYNILLTTYVASHLLAPSFLTDLLEFYQPGRILRSSLESLLVVHRAHLRQYGDREFCIAAPTIWKDLPRNMRKYDSIDQFKRLLKIHIFKRGLYS